MNRFAKYLGLLMLVFSVVAVGACERPGDRTEQQISEALRDANLDDVNVDYDQNNNVVHLRGTVGTTGERSRAEEIATNVVGNAGMVLNEIRVEGMEEERGWLDDRDREIRDRLNEMIDEDPELRDRDVDFDVNEGAVKITGEVRTEAEKQRVEEMVQGVEGVTDVANALEVRPAQQQRQQQ
jgi:hyperosmotically inducible periplasmic protein